MTPLVRNAVAVAVAVEENPTDLPEIPSHPPEAESSEMIAHGWIF